MLLGQPEDVPEHPNWDWRSELANEVELALRERLLEPMDNETPEPLLVPSDRLGREVGGEQPAVPPVLRRIELQEVAPRRQHVFGEILDRRCAPELRGERPRVLQHGEHVVVLRQCPEAAPRRLRMEVDGRLPLQALEQLPGLVVGEEVVVEEVWWNGLTSGDLCAAGAAVRRHQPAPSSSEIG